MARNTNPWFKFFYRDWLESERVRRMSPAAQGLYLRALCFQATHGSLPADPEELSICLQVKPSLMGDWAEVSPHFTVENNGVEDRLFNQRQRETLTETVNALEARRSAARSTNAKRNGHRDGQRTGQRTLRASDSVSISNSLLETKETTSKTKKVDKKQKPVLAFSEVELDLGQRFAQVRADISGMKSVKQEAVDFYAEVVSKILADGEADADGLKRIVNWFATTDEGKQSFGYGVGNLARGYKHTLQRNIAMYLAKSQPSFTTPPRGNQFGRQQEPAGFEYDVLGSNHEWNGGSK